MENKTGPASRRAFIKTASLAAAALPSLLQAQNSLTTKNMNESKIDITKLGSVPSAIGPTDFFTGHARIDMHFSESEPARASAATVTFAPGARTVWHTHPLGQRLIITSGIGWIQEEGFEKQEVKAGDVVWFPPHIKHWHGASAEVGMSHIAIQESENGTAVDWLEPVSDESYNG